MEFSEGASMDDLDKKKQQKNDNEERGWMDLHPDILELFLEKLHQLDDRIRFRSVCKNWRLADDQLLTVKSSDTLPWLLSFPLDLISPKLQILDPHARELYFTDWWPNNHNTTCEVFASKHGWTLLRGCTKSGNKLFLHNPFKNEVSLLPSPCFNMCNLAATLAPNTEYRGFQVVLFSLSRENYLYVSRYRLSSTYPNWERKYFGTTGPQGGGPGGYSIHYMKGKIYCFVDSNYLQINTTILHIYELADKCLYLEKNVILRMPDQVAYSDSKWRKYCLTDIGGNLILVVGVKNSSSLKFMVFSYDQSRMCWAESTDMEGISFFISDRSIISAPSDDLDCRVFYVDRHGEVYYYSLKEEKHIKADDIYSPREWKEDKMKKYGAQQECKRCFVEPAPYFWNSKSKFWFPNLSIVHL